ncbi:hypothetical protein J7E88_13845 [Streptomyces sp. ISL-10]|nr:hypothetical protein [Streptomyces sp. ISL-10]
MIDEFLDALDRDPGSVVERDWMEGHVLIQSFMMRSAPAVANILMAALSHYVSGDARKALLESLLYLSGGDSEELVAQCQEVIVRGAWIFLEEISSGRSVACASYAFEILEALDEDEWVRMARTRFVDLLPAEMLDPDHR